MSFKKNTAITGFTFGLVSLADGSDVTTGTPVGYYTLDGGTQTAIADVTPVHEGNGQWSFDLTAGEMNGDIVGLTFTHASAITAHFTIKTDTKIVSDLQDLTSAQVNTECDTALTDYDGPTDAEMIARTLLAADYFNPAADTVALVTDITNQVSADVTAISGDAVAADNLELQYDTTGLTGDTFPASQSQVASIGTISGGGQPFEITSDNTGGAIKGVTFVGVQTGTFANIEAEDGVYHVIDDTGDAIDIVYRTNVGGSRIASRIEWKGYLSSGNDSLNVQVYDFVGSDWETVRILVGQGGSNNITLEIPILLKHTGTGADLGDVLIRFVGSGLSNPQLNIDILHVQAVGATSSIGFEGGAVWLDTIGGTSGVGEGIGFINRPSDNITDALSIAASNNLKSIHSLPGTSITLPSSVDGIEFTGFSYTVALNGQSVSGTLFEGAIITGNDSGINAIHTVYSGCLMGSNTLGLHNLHDHCGLSGDIILAEAGTYTWVGPVSHVAGAGAPAVDFQAAVETKALNVRGIFGGLEIRNYNAGGGTHTMTLGGTGQRIFAASCAGGTLEQRGQFKETDNAGGAVAVVRDLVSQDARDILDDTGTTGVLLSTSATSVQLVGDVWDELLSGHNVGGSTGKALRQIKEGTVSAESTVNDLGATTMSFITNLTSAVDDYYKDISLVFIDGALVGQSRPILSYDGTTKEITLEEALTSAPADGVGFIIKTDHVHPISQIQSAILSDAIPFQGADIAEILADTVEIGAAGAGLTDLGGMSAAMKTEIEDTVWDTLLTPSFHNNTNSAGKRLRTIPSTLIRENTAQGAGTGNNQIQFDTGASAVDGTYDPSLVFIVGGTGVGQSRNILQYKGSTKTATVDRNWKVNPDATSEFVIVADAGREHVNEGLAQDGTINTIKLNVLASSIDDAYVGQIVFIRSGTGDDQSGTIIAYNGTTKVATIHRNWGVIPNITSGYVMLPASPVELTANALSSIKSDVTDVMTVDATVEPTSVPSSTAPIADKLGYILAKARNKTLQTATTVTVRNDLDTADIGSASVSDDGTIFTKDKDI